MKKIFIICSVRGQSDAYRKRLEKYVKMLESKGNKVHLPHRDTTKMPEELIFADKTQKLFPNLTKYTFRYGIS